VKKVTLAIMAAVTALLLATPATFAFEQPRDRNDNKPGMNGFGGKVAVFDSYTKVNDWISTVKVTFLPGSETTEVTAVSGLTEYLGATAGNKPEKIEPTTLAKGDWVFVSSIFGSPTEEGKAGKEFARTIVKPDLKLLAMGIRGRDMLGTVEKIDKTSVSIMPYGPYPEDKKPEAKTFNLGSNVLVFKTDDKENFTKLALSDVKVGSKVAVSVMPLIEKGQDNKKDAQIYAVSFAVMDNFPEMPKQELLATFTSSENSVMKVSPIAQVRPGDGRDDRGGQNPAPGKGDDKGGQNPKPLDGETPTPPEKNRGPKTIEVKFDSNTVFVLNTGDKIEKIDPANIREQDKLMMTVQMKDYNGTWSLYAYTVRVLQDIPNPKTSREVRVLGTLESFGEYSVTVKPYKGENSITLAVDPECKYAKMGEEGKRPEMIKASDIKAGDKLAISVITNRHENRQPGENVRPNDDTTPKTISGTVFMITVINEFPKPVAMGKITAITADKLTIEKPEMGRQKDDKNDNKTVDFVINSNTKFYTIDKDGKKEAKADQFKADEWVMVEFEENNGTNTAFSIVKVDRPPNNPQPNPGQGGEGGQPNPPQPPQP